MSTIDYVKGYKIGVEDGKRAALIELQKQNKNTNLPSNETLFKIIELVHKSEEMLEKTNSCYMNHYEYVANFITKNWNDGD